MIQSDVESAKEFVENLPYDKVKFTFGFAMLSARPNTYVFDNFKIKNKLMYGPFYYGYDPLINQEQIDITKQVANILYKPGVTVFDYYKIKDM